MLPQKFTRSSSSSALVDVDVRTHSVLWTQSVWSKSDGFGEIVVKTFATSVTHLTDHRY